MKKIGHYIINLLIWTLFFAAFWARNTYGNFTGDELFFHLLVPLGGISTQSFSSLAIEVFLPGVILGFISAFIIDHYFSKQKKFINVILLIIVLLIDFYKINLFTYLANQIQQSDFIENNYVETKDVKLTFPENKKNLIYIYLESMENTYTNKKNGGSNNQSLTPTLTKLTKEHTSFSNTTHQGGALSLNGTAWTAAAMVGQTSGLPLKINLSSNGIIDLNNFFPNTKTLGDILQENGYSNYLLLGSDSNYGCRKQYFEKHGNYKIYDLNTALEEKAMTEDDIVWWGFDDDDLFTKAKEQLTEIAKSKEPFNYTMLTVDTHFEDGYLAKTCEKKYADQYSNVISCADSKIAAFLTWLQTQDFYDDTVVILVGDHLSMDTDYFKDLPKDYTRTIYNVIINSSATTKYMTNRKFSTLDMFPTTLAALGVNIENDRLALGTNLYSKEKTLIEQKGYKYVLNELDKRSTFYNNNVLAYK